MYESRSRSMQHCAPTRCYVQGCRRSKSALESSLYSVLRNGVRLLSKAHFTNFSAFRIYTTSTLLSSRRYSQVVTATDSNLQLICSSLRAQVQILLASRYSFYFISSAFVEEMEGREEGRTERRKGGSGEGVWRSTGTGVVSIYDKNRFLISI